MEKFLQNNPVYYKEYYKKNREKILEKRRIWYEKQKEALKKYQKIYYEENKKNKPKISKRVRKQMNLEKILEENKIKAEKFKLLLSQTNI